MHLTMHSRGISYYPYPKHIVEKSIVGRVVGRVWEVIGKVLIIKGL